eukprot:NODE_1052_length_1035_cov_97.719163_g1007_i0.p2 GENE.NODE_1052_length_1035_cov_97.719163_g1007_i0~~NODE_1052_length_1035_cov_97.719163_g1007_i0.p2  ORF type:complete len:142 (+),score=43.63 NODE_1052_length_1035_cov_97.719163_g1007_i0:207-632(+)
MKPAWDQLGSEYEGSSSVVVADVDCTIEEELCQKHEVQGYPTIKYYTAETGKKGEDYNSGRDFDSLKKFVEDTLAGPGCQVADQAECSDKEKGYITKFQAKGKDAATKEHERLSKMTGSSMTATSKQWLKQRLNILKQLSE